ncbi:phytoene desaturase family protein [Radiobacillus sp. PE A8.2]|uniref:phytoene desaturase family protein n=1 Tax=Radiobacillus sp. PE A8.2 TaxID=3380349 RepID=UPI003890248B
MNITIVGGGIGGLTAALLLERQGHQVTIYEKNEELGGRLAFQSNGRFVIDQGPTIVLLPDLLLEILQDAGMDTSELELLSCDPLYDIYYADGSTFRKWKEIDKQIVEVERQFPGESFHFKRYMEDMEAVYQFGFEAFLSRIFKRKRDFLSFTNAKFVWQSQSYKNVQDFLSLYFDDIRLRHAYALQSLYIGGSPHNVPALYGLISYSEHAFGIWYLKGGYASLIPKLEQECATRNITIYKQTEVERIVTKNKKAQGVVINGNFQPSDAVVFNGDYPHLDTLLDTKKKAIKKYQPSSGCVLVYLGVNKRWNTAITHQFFLSDDFDQNMKEVFKENKAPTDPSCYVFNPCAIDSEAAPAGTSVLYFLIPVPSAMKLSDEVLDALVDQQIQRVENSCFKGLQASIEWKEVRTPRDAEAEGNYMGGSFGIAPNINQSGGFRPQVSHPTISGLYAVGASVHPGGGIPIVMQGARLLSELIEKEMEVNA